MVASCWSHHGSTSSETAVTPASANGSAGKASGEAIVTAVRTAPKRTAHGLANSTGRSAVRAVPPKGQGCGCAVPDRRPARATVGARLTVLPADRQRRVGPGPRPASGGSRRQDIETQSCAADHPAHRYGVTRGLRAAGPRSGGRADTRQWHPGDCDGQNRSRRTTTHAGRGRCSLIPKVKRQGEPFRAVVPGGGPDQRIKASSRPTAGDRCPHPRHAAAIRHHDPAKLLSRPVRQKEIQRRALEALYKASSPIWGVGSDGLRARRQSSRATSTRSCGSVRGVDRVEDCLLFERHPRRGAYGLRPHGEARRPSRSGRGCGVPIRHRFSYRHYVL